MEEKINEKEEEMNYVTFKIQVNSISIKPNDKFHTFYLVYVDARS